MENFPPIELLKEKRMRYTYTFKHDVPFMTDEHGRLDYVSREEIEETIQSGRCALRDMDIIDHKSGLHEWLEAAKEDLKSDLRVAVEELYPTAPTVYTKHEQETP